MKKFAVVLVLFALVACTQSDGRPTSAKSMEEVAAEAWGATSASFAASRAQRIKRLGSFASLPDRGELLTYQTRDSSRQEGAYTWHRASVSEEHALHAIVERKLRIATPAGEVLDIEYDHHIEHPSGDWTWVGHLPGHPGAQTIVTFGAEAVFGSIGQAGKRSLRLTSRDGVAWLVETDPSKLEGLASAGANPEKPDTLAVPKQLLSGQIGAAPVQRESAPAATLAAAATTIDVLVGYTGGIASRTGGASAALTRIHYLVATTNEAYANSQINAQVRLVHAMQVSYTDTSTNESTLEQLTGYDVSEQDFIPPNTAFNALRAAREQYGADLVVLLRQFRDPEQDGCGIAWLVGGGRAGIAPGDGNDYFGYSVVSDGTDRNEQDGNDYYCRDESFAHELAHNMGSQHDREEAKAGDGVLNDPDDYGAFPYSFGYKTGAAAGNFFTIMAYGDEGQQDYRVFSNPRITSICGGRACGTVNDDNARSLGQLMPIVASFRSGVIPLSGPVPIKSSGDFDNDGKDDLLWRNSNTGAIVIWKGAVPGQPLTAVPSQDWQMMGVGDIGGDGKADILWRNYATGVNTVWYAANSANSSYLTTLTGIAWMPASVGDFDGNNRADLIWRNTSTGANVIWKNAIPGQFLTAVTDQNWKVVGNGDFNGDGKSDLLWRNSITGVNVIWPSASSGAAQVLTSVTDLSWRIVGTGDFNGDHRADILWRNASTGANVIWRSAVSSQFQSLYTVSDQNWQIAGLGDYNGDLRTDIMWRNLASGQNVIWNSGNAATLRSLATVDSSWKVQP